MGAEKVNVIEVVGPCGEPRLTIHESGLSMTARWERKGDGDRWVHWLNMHFSKTT